MVMFTQFIFPVAASTSLLLLGAERDYAVGSITLIVQTSGENIIQTLLTETL